MKAKLVQNDPTSTRMTEFLQKFGDLCIEYLEDANVMLVVENDHIHHVTTNQCVICMTVGLLATIKNKNITHADAASHDSPQESIN